MRVRYDRQGVYAKKKKKDIIALVRPGSGCQLDPVHEAVPSLWHPVSVLFWRGLVSMWLFRVVSSAIFLTVIVLSVPLAFDVGGKKCGLAFSLSLSTFYFFLSLLKLTTPGGSRIRSSAIGLVRSTQWIIIPILLIWSLNRFSIDSDNSSGWVERTFGGTRAGDHSVRQWIFGQDGLLEAVTIGNWDKFLRWSAPVFQLAEGFCSLLVIQAAGQITRWLVNRGGRSDSWMVRVSAYKGCRLLQRH